MRTVADPVSDNNKGVFWSNTSLRSVALPKHALLICLAIDLDLSGEDFSLYRKGEF